MLLLSILATSIAFVATRRMRVPKILLLTPGRILYDQTTRLLAEGYPDIRVELGFWTGAIQRCEHFMAEGGEVVIARAGTTQILREALPLPVVDIPTTGFDLIATLAEAKKYGRKIGVLAVESMRRGVESLASILDLELLQYFMIGPDEAAEGVSDLIGRGAQVVVGGVGACLAAGQRGFPCVEMQTSDESIFIAVNEARYRLYTRHEESVRQSVMDAMLDHLPTGVVTVDAAGTVKAFNSMAESMLSRLRHQVLGKNAGEVLPELALEEVIGQGKDEAGGVLSMQDRHLVCHKTAARLGEAVVGAVATLHDVHDIQAMESSIRREVTAKGHVAPFTFKNIMGTSCAVKESVKLARHFARSDSSVLILGETGTGKELFAQSIHNESPRRDGPFVAINCAALPPQLLESELFGYVAGAFTDASKKGRAGLFEAAHRGTIFLDEIAEIDFATQGRLLRVLQEKRIMRLGSDAVTPVDIRIITATNKDLSAFVRENRFRDDLFYRLNVLRLRLPPLRERKGDIPALAGAFIRRMARRTGKPFTLTDKAAVWLSQQPWPGNIRELENILERATAISMSSALDEGVFVEIMDVPEQACPAPGGNDDAELELLLKALAAAKGHHGRAAETLGINRATLWRRLKKHGMRG